MLSASEKVNLSSRYFFSHWSHLNSPFSNSKSLFFSHTIKRTISSSFETKENFVFHGCSTIFASLCFFETFAGTIETFLSSKTIVSLKSEFPASFTKEAFEKLQFRFLQFNVERVSFQLYSSRDWRSFANNSGTFSRLKIILRPKRVLQP